MAQSEPAVIVLSPGAIAELWDIWRYNATRYGEEHADRYEAFLKEGIERLSTDRQDSRTVEGFSELRSVTLKKRRQGEGHIVIYRFDTEANQVNILHIFHTKMDVQGRLESG
jgi:plasmid stabilization system protein ParE